MSRKSIIFRLLLSREQSYAFTKVNDGFYRYKSTSFFQKLHITNTFLLSLHVVQVSAASLLGLKCHFWRSEAASASPQRTSCAPLFFCSLYALLCGFCPLGTFIWFLLLVKMKIMAIRADERLGKTEIHLQLQCQLMPHGNIHFKSFENLFFPLYCFSPLVYIPTVNGRVALAHCDIVPVSACSSAQNAFLSVLWELLSTV